ncbi:MAG: glycosyltransferase family 10 [Candidatus Micrarchaeia archaeon]
MGEILFCRGGEYAQNQLFCLQNEILNRDNTLRPFYELKKSLGKKGFEANTVDMTKNFKDADAYIFFDIPKKQIDKRYYEMAKKTEKKEIYLILYEPPATRPDNYDRRLHENFRRIMTWNDDFIDGTKYIKGNFATPYMEGEKIEIPHVDFDSRKMMCMVTANKYSAHPDQLYTARTDAAKWMEKNHPQEFDLYGQRWELPVFHSDFLERAGVNNLSKAMHKFKVRLPNKTFYKSNFGPIKNKKEVMQKYKFCICYENQRDVPGYVSEKIFDAFFSGCVPIYLGANNIEKYVPKKCFIDMRDFDEFEQVHANISKMERNEFEERVCCIEDFLNSKKCAQFKINHFVSQFEKMVGI